LIQKKISGASASEISHSLEQAVREGRLSGGEAVPPVRELSAALGVSAATVAAAYRRLQARGLLVADGRRGTRVRPAGHLPGVHDHPVPAAGLIDLASGSPAAALLPPLDDALRTMTIEATSYDSAPELPALATFARSEFVADGIAADAVVVTSGALDAIERLLREHLRHGDRVIVEDPHVPAIVDLLAASGLVAEPVAVDGEGPRPDALDAALRRHPRAMIVTPRAQNPTGAAISGSRAGDLRKQLKPHDELLLIENDPFAPIAGVPAVTLTEGRAHWAVVRSTSKFLGPDLRVAVVAGDAMTIGRVRGRQSVGPRWVSHLLQQLVVSLWSDPSSGRRLARAADVYAHRRSAFVRALQAHDIVVGAASGFNVWIPVHHESAVVQQMAERGWAVAAGERFRLRAGPGIRVTTSGLEPEAAKRFSADLAQALRRGSRPLG
jgi:DNA-binding transcriptional MocR family regulator